LAVFTSPNWHPWKNFGEDLGMQIAVFTENLEGKIAQ
jgi:hypothetical protein